MAETNHYVLIRRYKSGDELRCRELIKNGIMSSMNSAFVGNILKEITFQMMILFAAVMFIFFSVPSTVCICVIPLVLFITYIGTCIAFRMKAMDVDSQVQKIPQIYMSNAFSCFWVAEAFSPVMGDPLDKDTRCFILNEEQFRTLNIDESSHLNKIIGCIALSKSYNLDKGAWIKRLCVHPDYQRKGIASCLLNTAVEFAIKQGYSCVNLVASEYNDGGRELCLKKGFELKQLYHKHIIGSLISVLMYELTYQIKPGSDNNYSSPRRRIVTNYEE